jgi:hypothetical protein
MWGFFFGLGGGGGGGGGRGDRAAPARIYNERRRRMASLERRGVRFDKLTTGGRRRSRRGGIYLTIRH